MITNDTVLILGAGASIPFGFPTGRELLKKVCLILRGGNGEFDILKNHGYDEDYIREFGDTLAKSGQTSVDAFLQHGNQFIDVGKEAIAAALLPHEQTVMLFDVPRNKYIPNWYELLFSELNTSFEEFDKNKLSIVTFNYDRSIEHYLFTAFKNTHHKSDEECAQKIETINIVHLYGKFGDLPWQNTGFSKLPYQAYSDQKNYGLMVKRGGENIRIIHELTDVKNDPNFHKAHELLNKAARIYFLGFGFNELNVKRLLPEYVLKRPILRGTGFDLSPHQRRKINSLGLHGISDYIHKKDENDVIWTTFPNKKVYEFLYNDRNAILD